MKYRKLRIAWSVGCGVLCLLLIALWVRSYCWTHYLLVQDSASQLIAVDVSPGTLSVRIGANATPNRWGEWQYTRRLGLWREYIDDAPGTPRRLKWWLGNFNVSRGTSSALNASAPFWFVVPLFITLAFMSWVRWHFTLRTLLIGMTVAGVVLGLMMWAAG
jgi:hypothetical protein